MKSILMTTSAVFLVTGFAAAQAQAACPEDIDAFTREYEQTLQSAEAGQALTTSEQAQLFGLRTAAEKLYASGEADSCVVVIQRARTMLGSAIAPQVIKPSELVGRNVTNAAGEKLGEIEDVMIDPVSGRIAYVVLEHGGFLGIGDDLFAVPWRAMTFVPGDEETVLLDIPEEKLENAPRFSREDETPLERREWVTSVHTYYGVEPYWQDSVGSMAMQYGGAAGAAGASGESGGTATTTETVPVIVEGADQSSGLQPGGSEQQTGQQQTGQQQTGQQQVGDSQQPAGASEPATDVVVIAPVTEGAQPATDDQSQAQSEASTSSDQAATAPVPAPAAPPVQQEGQSEQQQPAPSATSSGDSTGDTTGASAGGSGASGSTQALLAPQPGVSASGASTATQPSAETAAVPSDEVSLLIDRIDQLEQRVQELSQSGVGAEVEQSISSLEQEVQQLAQKGPGEEVTQAIQRLEGEVQKLAQQGPGEEVTQAISRLESQVQQLSDQGLGTEIRQQLASIEERLASFGDSGGPMGTNGQGEPAAVVIVPDQSPGTEQQSGQQPPQQQPAQTQPDSGTAEPSQSQAAQPQSEQQSAAPQPQSSQQPTQATGSQGGQQPAAGQQQAAQPPADTDGQQNQEVVIQGTTVPAVPAAPADAASEMTGEPCEKLLAVLEEDLQRAEKLGIAVNDARSEYKEAQAMLNNNSEALCRAAIRRAHDELVADGFEPTALN